MDKRSQGEELYREKFEEHGLSERFEFIKRIWESDHGRKMIVRCKTCGAEFSIWNEVFKGRQQNLYCKECGASSDGKNSIKARNPKVKEAMSYYVDGHSVTETALAFGFTKVEINNWVKMRGLSNGREWQTSGTEARIKRLRLLFYCRKSRDRRTHRSRAQRFGCEYDPTVNLKKLIERDGLKCAICGGLCNMNDRRWGNGIGPLYPTLDHIVPLSKKGGHIWENVQIAHAICNVKKGAKLMGVNA